jgi:putative sterol carrier protein
MSDVTVQKIIENHPKYFQASLAEGMNVVIQYVLTGAEASNYYITIKDGTCTTAEGLAEKPSMTLAADSQDFKDVLTGKVNGMQYFMTGKLKLSGDLNLAMKLPQLFKMSNVN